ncbi:MAG TPA: VOC family protein [Ramlibacter sp.]|nr:VOC family protein [Ramlibacter sp.]
MKARIDHLVVLADSLEQGAAWCERTLGVPPGPGGEHPLMGTHNRLLRIATVDYPRAYFEIIARKPGAQPQGNRRRWFDLDDAHVQQAIREVGPRLAHWVVQVPDVRAAVAALARLGIERGPVVAASRMTDKGLLSWQITVRDDGTRLFGGCLPTLIEWGERHPAAAMPESGLTLHGVALRHPQAALLRSALEAIGLEGVGVEEGPANLTASLRGPNGAVRLESGGV